MAAACALAHRLRIAGEITLFCGVAHRALCVVHRTHHLANERQERFVAHLVELLQFAPLHLLLTSHSLEVEHIRIGVGHAVWHWRTMEVAEQAVFGASGGSLFKKLHHLLVAAVHEVDFETLHAHFAIVAAHILHIALKGLVASPKHDIHATVGSIFHKHRQVDFRHHLHQVGFLVHRPTLIENHVFNAVFGGEVDIILIGAIVHASGKIHAFQVPVVPPVPSHLARLHPIGIHHRRIGKQSWHLGGEQVGIVFSHQHHFPWEGVRASRLGDIVFPLVNYHLQIVVVALIFVLRIGREETLHHIPFARQEKHAGITAHIVVANQQFFAVGKFDEHGRQTEVLTVEVGEFGVLIGILKRAIRLVAQVVGLVVRVGRRFVSHTVGWQAKFHLLVGYGE